MLLGDLGADVIKVERPGEGDEARHWGPPFAGGESAYFLCTNRNKRSVALDLARPDHREAARRLVARADVLVENFRPGAMDRLGLGWEDCRALNPRLVYGSISGFGLGGDARERPGYDFVVQAMGGVMSITGEPGREPQKVGVAIADITAGMFCAIAILAALTHADRSGEGQRVHASLLGAQVAWLANQASNYLVGGIEPARMGNAHPNIVPYQVFEASDEAFVLAVPNDGMWRRFCGALSLPDLAGDERFRTNGERVRNRSALVERLAALFRTRPRDEWLALIEAAAIPCSPINSIAEVFADPRVRALGILEEVEHPSAGRIRLVGSPLDLALTPASTRRPPPRLGEHTDEVLAWLGYEQGERRTLAEDLP